MMAVTVAAALLVSVSQGVKSFPNTPLFSGITEGDYDAGQLLIRQRVSKVYSIGNTEIGFEEYLKSQGLSTRRITNSAAPDAPIYGESEFVQSGLCDQVVRINWRADKDRIIREIIVAYSSIGCL